MNFYIASQYICEFYKSFIKYISICTNVCTFIYIDNTHTHTLYPHTLSPTDPTNDCHNSSCYKRKKYLKENQYIKDYFIKY